VLLRLRWGGSDVRLWRDHPNVRLRASPIATSPRSPQGSRQSPPRLDQRAQVLQFLLELRFPDLEGGAVLALRGVGGVFLPAAPTSRAGARRGDGPMAGGRPARPWIATDQEGGTVQSLSGHCLTALQTAVEQGAPG
jgi:beta-N-acetylhexosaminidase